MTPIKKLEYQLLQKQKEINELYVVIDTLQNTLGAAVSYLSEKELKDLKNHSYHWCTKWKVGDERQS